MALAQAAKRIERLDPGWTRSSPPRSQSWNSPPASAAIGPAEGPVWWKEGGYLLFSDIHNNKRMKYTPGQGVAYSRRRPTAPMA